MTTESKEAVPSPSTGFNALRWRLETERKRLMEEFEGAINLAAARAVYSSYVTLGW